MALEIELKFQLSDDFPGATEALQTLLEMEPAYQLDSYYQHRLDNLYFDTPEQALRQQDIGLRWRYFPDYIEQTLKGPAQGALLAREEYTKRWPLSITHPTLSDLPFWSPSQAEQLTAQLRPLFRTTFTRYTWEVSLPEGSVEIVYDRGNITTPGQDSSPADTLCELEIELISGDVAAVFRIAQDLAQQGNMVLSILSKAARGYQRAALAPVQSTKPLTLWQQWHQHQQGLLAHHPTALSAMLALAQSGTLPLSTTEQHELIQGLQRDGAAFCYTPTYNLMLLGWLDATHHQRTV